MNRVHPQHMFKLLDRITFRKFTHKEILFRLMFNISKAATSYTPIH